MSGDRGTYLDSSAIVKLVVGESESETLRGYLRQRGPYVSSALARTEVTRAVVPAGEAAVRRGHDVLARIRLVRITDRVLAAAGTLSPPQLRSLHAIHLATAQQLGADLARLVTYDERMAGGARGLGWTVAQPS